MEDQTSSSDDVAVFCPRCDKEFKAPRKREAMSAMYKHLKKAHPDYYELMVKD